MFTRAQSDQNNQNNVFWLRTQNFCCKLGDTIAFAATDSTASTIDHYV